MTCSSLKYLLYKVEISNSTQYTWPIKYFTLGSIGLCPQNFSKIQNQLMTPTGHKHINSLLYTDIFFKVHLEILPIQIIHSTIKLHSILVSAK